MVTLTKKLAGHDFRIHYSLCNVQEYKDLRIKGAKGKKEIEASSSSPNVDYLF